MRKAKQTHVEVQVVGKKIRPNEEGTSRVTHLTIVPREETLHPGGHFEEHCLRDRYLKHV